MKYIVFVIGWVLYSVSAWAGFCDIVLQQSFDVKNLGLYERCALQENNDSVQSFLGRSYLNGENGIAKNISRGLLFYHLSAENGNASSQIALAKQLLKMDENDDSRAQLKSYLEKVAYFMKGNKDSSFDGSILHPYTLLMLAAEKADQKWFYASEDLDGTLAGGLIQNYKISPDKKQQALRAASEWKQKKIFEAAREIYESAAYQKFEQAIRPKVGRADAFTRAQAMEQLKRDIQKYKEK